MNLTGTPLLAALGTLALFAVTAAVWLLPRVPGPLARTGLLAACQVFLLLALLAMGNAYFVFYGSWSDLLGLRAADGHVTAGLDRRPLVRIRDPFVEQHAMPERDGRLEAVLIRGARSGVTARAYVYLPPEYLRDPRGRFAVNIAFTGYPGNAQNLITRLRLPQTAAQEIEAGRLRPTIFVMTRPTVAPPRDTECTDVPHGPAAETFFAQDLPAALRTAYRVMPGPAGWSTLGDSTGGYCAVKLAMRHSDRFGAAVSLSGYYRAISDFTTGDLYGGSSAYRNENDLEWRLRHRPAPPVDVLVATSRVGERDYGQTLRFLSLVRPPMRAASIMLPVGGHRFSVWGRELVPALRWLDKRR
jgi:enterochelin esterase-like enzyme